MTDRIHLEKLPSSDVPQERRLRLRSSLFHRALGDAERELPQHEVSLAENVIPHDEGLGFDTLLAEAEAGNPIAQLNLGYAFENGDYPGSNKRYEGGGVSWTANKEQALRWFRAAGEAGQADAQWKLGELYRMGDGVSEDHDEARKWYGRAAIQGHKDARLLFEVSDYDEMMSAAYDPDADDESSEEDY